MPMPQNEIQEGRIYFNEKSKKWRTVIDVCTCDDKKEVTYVNGLYVDEYYSGKLPDLKKITVKLITFARWADV